MENKIHNIKNKFRDEVYFRACTANEIDVGDIELGLHDCRGIGMYTYFNIEEAQKLILFLQAQIEVAK